MELISQWVAFDDAPSRRAFLVRHLHRFEMDQTVPDINLHLTNQLKNQANQLRNTVQRHKALELADSLLFLSVVLPSSLPRARNLARARAMMVQANFARANGDFNLSATFLKEAHHLCQNNDSPLEAIRCNMGLVDVYARMGCMDQALALAEETLQQAEQTDDIPLLTSVLSNIGTMYFQRDEYARSIEIFQRQAGLLSRSNEASSSPASLLNCLYNMALSYFYLGNFDQVIALTGQVYDLSQQLAQTLWQARAEQLMADAQFQKGHFTKALRIWDTALALYQSQNSPLDAHWVNQARCLCLVHVNRLEDALELCRYLIEEARQAGWWKDQATLTYWRALIEARLGLDDIALASFEAATGLFTPLEAPGWVAWLRLDQAALLVKLEDYTRAEQVLAAAEVELRRQNMPRWLAQARLTQVRLVRGQGDPARAARMAEELLQTTRDLDLPGLNYQVLQLLGELAEESHCPEQALEYYCQAIAQVERLRGAITLELRGEFLKDKTGVYEAVVINALSRADLDQTYDYIERSKSRALTELLTNRFDLEVKARNAADEPLLAELARLRMEHAQYYQLLNQSREMVSSPRREVAASLSPEFTTARDELRLREKKIEQLLQRLEISNAAYAEDFSLLQAHSASPAAWLDPATALVEYYIARDEVLALVITRNEQRVFRHLITVSKLERAMQSLSLVLHNTSPALAARLLPATQAQLGTLFKALFKPLAEFAGGFSHLIFVPHGPLHYLPFHALWDAQTGRYLVQDFEVSYLPAASQLGFYRERAAQSGQAGGQPSLVLGFSGNGRLPYVTREAREVAASLGTGTVLRLEQEARRTDLEQPGDTRPVIHLATHGQFRADAPLFSFVELAGERLLTIDIFNLNLKARLVTLSACESGLNVITGGDELVGLSRACLYAGAASLLLSLWRVEDRSTTLLMKDFYRRLNSPGATLAAGLRQAQLTLLENGAGENGTADYRHPYFWAPFFLFGEAGRF